MGMRSIAAAVLMLAGASQAPAADGMLSRVAWLAGCWRSADGEAGSAEHWMPVAGGTMLGMSRTVRRGRTVAHEFLQIRDTGDGRLVYIAQPSGQPMAQFTSTRIGEGDVVFENPEHDFPQRILYRLEGEGRLHARIEGTVKGAARGVDFPMERASCEATR